MDNSYFNVQESELKLLLLLSTIQALASALGTMKERMVTRGKGLNATAFLNKVYVSVG